jgi:C-terminal processing protease CtpA/Prc
MNRLSFCLIVCLLATLPPGQTSWGRIKSADTNPLKSESNITCAPPAAGVDSGDIHACDPEESRQFAMGSTDNPSPAFTPNTRQNEDLGKGAKGDDQPRQTKESKTLTEQELENLIAFTRLMGYVQFFHPSDEAASTNWIECYREGIAAVRRVDTPADLAQTLQDFFEPVAPAIRVFPTGTCPPDIPVMIPPGDTDLLLITQWQHEGVEFNTSPDMYKSTRRLEPAPNATIPEGYHDPRSPYIADLEGSITCHVPLALFVNDSGTYPSPAGQHPWNTPTSPDDYSVRSETTRLAAVAMTWNVFQHFYPYFDVIETDWAEALSTALSSACTDHNELDLARTLRILVKALHDGHANVYHSVDYTDFYSPALTVQWIENRLVVTYTDTAEVQRIRPGDVILAVDGVPAEEALAEKKRYISGATPQYILYRATSEVLMGSHNSKVTVDVLPHSGEPYTLELIRTTAFYGGLEGREEPRPESIAELGTNFYYVDMTRTSTDHFANALPQLKRASGLIFDLRGYPRISILRHLIDAPVNSPPMYIPEVSCPDRVNPSFQCSQWTVYPGYSFRNIPKIFLTDGRAISYAETYMGIIEHYQIGDIVGGPTAGTNGNVNTFILPGGYEVPWTGMKVLKHDGSQHHGVGIVPTHPVSRTIAGVAEGRDEVLEYAMDVLGVFSIGAEPPSGHAPLTVQFSIDLSHVLTPSPLVEWDFNNDGVIDDQEYNPTWTYGESGTYSVRVAVLTDSLSNSATCDDLIHVFSGESALMFNEESGYARCPASPSLNLTEAFTLEAWIYPTGWGQFPPLGHGMIVDKNNVSLYLIDSNDPYHDHSALLKLVHSDGTISFSNTQRHSLRLNQWQHLAVTYSGYDTVKMYLNAVEHTIVHTSNPSGPIQDNGHEDLIIGNTKDFNRTFDGRIDEVRIWKTVRSATEIQADMSRYLCGDEPQLVGYWQMNEGQGERIADRSILENTGAVHNAIWRSGVFPARLSDDRDKDGVENCADICPDHYNPQQDDTDSDGLGDECDNCPEQANPDQADSDADSTGDVCDPCTDTDGDGYGDPGFQANACDEDNCPDRSNPDQNDVERGNVDCLEGIDVLDALMVINHILGIDPLLGAPLERADCNDDGDVDIIDALGIINVILGLGECFPHLKPGVNADVIHFCQGLKPHFSSHDFNRFVALVKAEFTRPATFDLYRNAPNPFNPITTIGFALPEATEVQLTVYNILGQTVAVLVDAQLEAGRNSVQWDASSMASGVYFYRLKAGDFTATKKMALIK